MCCVHKIRVVKAINRAEKCRGASKQARFFWFAADGFTRHNWLSALVEARELFPDASFALPDWEGNDIYKASKLLNRPCPSAKFLAAFRAVLAHTCFVPNPRALGVAWCKKVLSTIARFRFVAAAGRNELGRSSGALSSGQEFTVPPAILARWKMRQSVMPDIYSTEGVELGICENLVEQVLATLGGVDHFPFGEGIPRVDRGAPLLAASPATDARLLEILGPDPEDEEEEEEQEEE
jgi:hypothetical protein